MSYYCEETGETYEPEDSPPQVGEVKFILYWDEDGKVFKGGNFEFTEEGQWIEI